MGHTQKEKHQNRENRKKFKLKDLRFIKTPLREHILKLKKRLLGRK